MISAHEFLQKKRAELERAPELEQLPGQGELEQLCNSARAVAQVCNALGIEFRGYPHLMGLLEAGVHRGVDVVDILEDPDDRPYIWDLED